MSVIRVEDKSDIKRLIEGHIEETKDEESRVYKDQINCCGGAKSEPVFHSLLPRLIID